MPSDFASYRMWVYSWMGAGLKHTDTADGIKNALLLCTLKHICCETDQIRAFVSMIDCFTVASAAHSPHLCYETLDRCCCLSVSCVFFQSAPDKSWNKSVIIIKSSLGECVWVEERRCILCFRLKLSGRWQHENTLNGVSSEDRWTKHSMSLKERNRLHQQSCVGFFGALF